jgi:hypothetical protein
MNDNKAVNWKEYYLDTLEDPTTEMPKYPTLVMFLVLSRHISHKANPKVCPLLDFEMFKAKHLTV